MKILSFSLMLFLAGCAGEVTVECLPGDIQCNDGALQNCSSDGNFHDVTLEGNVVSCADDGLAIVPCRDGEEGSGEATGDGGSAPECSQSDAECGNCLEDAYTFKDKLETYSQNESLIAFDDCYEGSEGALNGDPGECAALHPEGATLWLDLVVEACEPCNDECCNFCSSEWGALSP